MNYRVSKSFLFAIILTIFLSVPISAQNKQKACLIGINPSITVEPFYKTGECDINILPLVYQRTLTKRTDIRFSSIFNYGIRNTTNRISHFGCQIAMPVFLNAKDSLQTPSKGLFLAPGIGITRNTMEKHTNAGIWIEPGYNLLIKNKWSFSFGIQIGATHFNYDNGIRKWGNHFGVKIIIGCWF